MPRRKKVEPADLLGPTEAQIMAVLWQHPGVGGMEASRLLNERRACAPISFRTVLTVLGRLERKGFVQHSIEGKRTFLYRAVVAEGEFVQWHADRAVKDMLGRYGGDITISGLANAADTDPALAQRLDELLDR